jgi:hypothetical protein
MKMASIAGASAERKSEIRAIQDELDKTLTDLEGSLEELNQRLEPVLRCEPTCEHKLTVSSIPESSVPLVQSLSMLRRRIQAQTDRIQEIKALLEI